MGVIEAMFPLTLTYLCIRKDTEILINHTTDVNANCVIKTGNERSGNVKIMKWKLVSTFLYFLLHPPRIITVNIDYFMQ